jgi:hypothetical protein
MKRSKLSKNILIMKKAMASHMTVIILGVLIMSVIFLLGSKWLTKTVEAVNPEKLTEIGDDSATESEDSTDQSSGEDISDLGSSSASEEEIPRVFTTDTSSNDLSEVACSIGNDIYTDFSSKGLTGGRSEVFSNTIPLQSATGYLVGSGSFAYSKGADASISDTVFDTAGYPDCHICKVGTTGISDLDEYCINLQLQDRKVGQYDSFCSGSVTTPLGTRVKFGNKDAYNWNSWGSNPCSNDEDRIWWYATNKEWSEDWKTSDNSIEPGNDLRLADGRNYIYGVYWIPGDGGNRYDVVFTRAPQKSSYEASNFNDIKSVLSDYDDLIRYTVVGEKYWEARTVAEFTVKPTSAVSMGSIMDMIKTAHDGISGLSFGYGNIIFNACTGDDCFTDGIKAATATTKCTNEGFPVRYLVLQFTVASENVYIYTNATNNGVPIISSGRLQGGKTYKVIIKNWADVSRKCEGLGCYTIKECFSEFDRSVVILEVS